MSWLPRWVITRGLFAGVTPHGTLNGIPSYLGGNLVVASPFLSGGAGYYEDFFTHELEKTWEGAYGSNAESMIRYAQQHGDTDGILLAEFTVNNPPNATYYKQTITFYGEVTYQNIHDEHSDIDNIVCSVNKMCRLEYTNPSSTPIITHTWLYRPFQCPNAYILHTGDPTEMRLWFYNKMRCGFGFLTYSDEEYFGAFLYAELDSFYEDNPLKGNQGCIIAVKCSELSEAFGIDFDENDNPLPDEIDDPNEEEPPEDGPGRGGSGGGEGEHILPDEPVPIPPVPEIGAASVSWLKLFKMTTNQLNDFGEAMIPKTAWQLLQVYFTNPLDAIIGILLIPVNAPTSGARTPALGDFTWPSAYPIINNEFYELDCGAVRIPPYWDSAFDFSPFTKFQIFLPFIGYRDIDADEIMGAGVQIKYHIDLCTGDCTAFIARSATPEDEYGPKALQVIAQYNGNCATRVPTGRISHDSAVTASMSLLGSALNVGGAIMGAALGNPGNISASQVANQVSGGTMTAVNGFKKEVQRSGNIAAAAGYMGILRPYIIRQIPRQDLPKEYKRLEGYPANKGGTLAQFAGSGLNTVEAMELTGFNGFESEREELLSILRGGVIV